jgi:hypothetical protein
VFALIPGSVATLPVAPLIGTFAVVGNDDAQDEKRHRG